MSAVSLYLGIYGKAFRDTFTAIRKSPWTLLLAVAVLLVRDLAVRVALPLGFIGGILATLATAALTSCYLYFLRDLVMGGRVSVKDVTASLGAYLWSIINVYFVVWIASLAVQLLLGANPNATAIFLALWTVMAVAFNAVPEVIYLRGTYGGLQTIGGSWEFLKEQWIPWFAANVPLLAAFGALALYAGTSVAGNVLVGAAFHVVMVFRGNLFRALDGSTHRRRMFQQRAG